jgi:hypothetical protein
MPMDRREFGREAALALLGGATITLYGCGGGGSSYSSPVAPSTPAPSSGTGGAGEAMGSISSNHGHAAVITGAQLTAGNGLRLDIRGQADHSHSVDLSAAQVAQVRGSTRVSIDSTDTQGHQHAVVFNGQPDNDNPY